jgi:hypothetical protein
MLNNILTLVSTVNQIIIALGADLVRMAGPVFPVIPINDGFQFVAPLPGLMGVEIISEFLQ